MKCSNIMPFLYILYAIPLHASEIVTYQYDVLGRLIERKTNSGPNINNGTQISYDPAGNRICLGTTIAAPNNRCPTTVNATQSLISTIGSTVNEGELINFKITRNGYSATAVSASYSTVDGSGVSGINYLAANGTITFNPGVTNIFVPVATRRDGQVTPNLTMSLILASPSDGAVLENSVAAGTIMDLDSNALIAKGVNLTTPKCIFSSFDLRSYITDPLGVSEVSVQSFIQNSGSASASGNVSGPVGLISINPGNVAGTSVWTYTLVDTAGRSASSTVTLNSINAKPPC